jgi:hypothetical protein
MHRTWRNALNFPDVGKISHFHIMPRSLLYRLPKPRQSSSASRRAPFILIQHEEWGRTYGKPFNRGRKNCRHHRRPCGRILLSRALRFIFATTVGQRAKGHLSRSEIQSERTVTARLGAMLPPEVAVISVTVTFLATSGLRGGESGGNFAIASFSASPKSNFWDCPVAWWLLLTLFLLISTGIRQLAGN